MFMFFLTGFYRQQLHRKRHVGNDVVVVVFCEGDDPFNPEVLTSNYNHVFILVRPVPDDPMGEGAKGEERKKGFSHAQKKKKKKKKKKRPKTSNALSSQSRVCPRRQAFSSVHSCGRARSC